MVEITEKTSTGIKPNVAGLLCYLVGWITGLIVDILLGLGMFVLWIVLMYKAYQGEKFKLPIIGDFAEKQTNQTNKQ